MKPKHNKEYVFVDPYANFIIFKLVKKNKKTYVSSLISDALAYYGKSLASHIERMNGERVFEWDYKIVKDKINWNNCLGEL